MTLKKLYRESGLDVEGLQEYCEQETGYRGFGSFKYCINRLRDEMQLPEAELLSVFRKAVEEIAERGLDPRKIRGCWGLMAFEPWRKQLRRRPKLDLRWLEDIMIGGHLVIINETGQNLTAKIFREIPIAEAIVFYNSAEWSWGIVFHQKGKMVTEQEKIIALIDALKQKGYNPTAVGNPINLIFYGGKRYGLPADGMRVQDIINIMEGIWQ